MTFIPGVVVECATFHIGKIAGGGEKLIEVEWWLPGQRVSLRNVRYIAVKTEISVRFTKAGVFSPGLRCGDPAIYCGVIAGPKTATQPHHNH